jgi:hypothetical protein
VAGSHPGKRISAALKNYVANTAVSWPGRLRQIHEQDFWNGA